MFFRKIYMFFRKIYIYILNIIKRMVKYICERCHYTTNRKNDYKNHLNRKHICDSIYSCISTKDLLKELNFKNLTYNCLKCNKSFKTSQSKYQHQKNCKKNKNIKNLRKQTIINNNTNSNNITNIENQNNINFIINFDNYTSEHLNIEEFKEECRKALSSNSIIEYYIKQIFFNKEHPENMNIKLTNLKPDYKYMDVYRDGWEKDLQNKIINKIIQDSYKLTSKIIVNEEPDYNINDYNDLEEYDKLKIYQNKFITNIKFKKNLNNIGKKTIYNESKLLISLLCN